MTMIGCMGVQRINQILKKLYQDDPDIQFCDQMKNSSIIYINYGKNLVSKPGLLVLLRALLTGKKIIVHWIGTDVFEFLTADRKKVKERIRSVLLRRICNLSGVVNWVAAEHLMDELAGLGIQSRLVYIPTELCAPTELMPLPEKTAVLTYLPESRANFYGLDLILELARQNSGVTFHIVAHSGKGLLHLNNVIYHGWVDQEKMDMLYQNCTAVIRLPKHDALGGTVIEGVLRGRYAIWSYHSVYTYQAHDYASAQQALDEIKHKTALNLQGRDYVLENFSLERLKQELKEAVQRELRVV